MCYVERGELPGHPALFNGRARALRSRHSRKRQEENTQGGRLLCRAGRSAALPAAAPRPGRLHRAGSGAAGRAAEGANLRGAHLRRGASQSAAHLGQPFTEILVERYITLATEADAHRPFQSLSVKSVNIYMYVCMYILLFWGVKQWFYPYAGLQCTIVPLGSCLGQSQWDLFS